MTLMILCNGSMHRAIAQGWVWGKAGAGVGIDGWAMTVDGVGNVFAGGNLDDYGSISFGSHVLSYPMSRHVLGTVWVKYDPNGVAQWADGIVAGRAYLKSITTDPSGNLILFGAFDLDTIQIGSFVLRNTTLMSEQYFLAKVSPAGTVLWAVNDGDIIAQPIAGTLEIDVPIWATGSVTTDAGGNIYIASSFRNKHASIGTTVLTNADTIRYTNDIFVAKYTPAGVPLWASSIGSDSNDYALGITVSSTGNIYVAGTFLSSSISVGSSIMTNPLRKPKGYIAKFSSTGIPLWAQCAGGRDRSYAVGLSKDNYGNVYMTGCFADSSISFGNNAITRYYPRPGSYELFLAQVSSADTVTWSKTIGSPDASVFGYGVALAPCGQVWVNGGTGGGSRLTIDAGDTLVLPASRDPIFIAGYNLSGGVAGYSSLGTGGDDQSGIACDAAGNVFICSDNFDSVTIGADFLPYEGDENIYVAKYSNVTYHPDTVYSNVDTVNCTTTTGITLTAPSGYSAYYWDNDSITVSRNVNTSGKYYVYCITCGSPVFVDIFNVTLPDTVYLRKDTSVCNSISSITLGEAVSYSSYHWNTGAISSSITVSDTSLYWVCASQGCSILFDTFKVNFISLPIVELGNDTTICIGSSVALKSAQPPGYSYLWNTASVANSINITSGGVYWLAVDNMGCVATDSIQITEISPPQHFELGHDTASCDGGQIILNVINANGTIIWSTGEVNPSIIVTETGTYWTTISNQCGISSDTINVDFGLCDIWFPSAFTPNGDGLNDVIRVKGSLKYYKNFSMSIYDRWGRRIYFSQDIYAGWDGNFNGVKQDLGTYFYMIAYSFNGHNHLMKGDFELIW